MKVLGDPRLKQAHAPDVAAAIAQTFGGMAHFAGTGHAGRTCRECSGWCRGAKKFARDKISEGGELKPRRCRTFTKLMAGLDGVGVPHGASACRHFVEAADAPPREAPLITKRRAMKAKKKPRA